MPEYMPEVASEWTGKYITAKGYSGVALYVHGPVLEWVPETMYEYPGGDETEEPEIVEDPTEGEWVPQNDGTALSVTMVGDDMKFVVDLHDCTVLEESEFCGGCGQIGCGHG